jgi:hypothetical protein
VIPPGFENFFLASAGAAAALIGLLFVAVSIAPERTVMAGAPMERKAVAAVAFSALLNAFFVSLSALLPDVALGPVALVMAIIGLANGLNIGWRLLRERRGWLSAFRRAFLSVAGLFIFGYQLVYALALIRDPADRGALYVLTWLLLATFGLGIVRAWELLGAQRFGVLAWLSPLHELGYEEPIRKSQSGSGPHSADSAKPK